jgi:hypothetical protein
MGGVTTRAARVASLAGAILSTSCGGEETPVGKGPYAREVAEALPKIEQATDLRFKSPPVVQARSAQEVRSYLEERFREDLSDQEIAGTQAAYRILGAIPDTLDLRAFMLDLLTEQVVGYYDPKTNVLYVVKDAPREQVSAIVAHELVHALQDQYTDLTAILGMKGNDDQQLAAHAVMEGQATLAGLEAVLGVGTDIASRLPGGWQRVRELIRETSSSMPVFAEAPLILQESLVFPYLNGAEFMRRFVAKRPEQMPYGDALPTSTEQIMHTEAYFGATRDQPVRISLAARKGLPLMYENNLGEFIARLVLFQHLNDQNAAVRAAAGWGGDRYMVLETRRGPGLAWLSVWDTPFDAAEFNDAIQQVIAKRFGSPEARAAGPQAKSYTARGRSIWLWGGDLQGRPAVVYADAPAGTQAEGLLDLKGVRLER